MRRLEPRNEHGSLRLRDFAKAHEGLHLMHVAPHGLGRLLAPGHVVIAGDMQQLAFAMGETPEQAIQKGVATRVGMRQHRIGKAQKLTRYRPSWLGLTRWLMSWR